MADHHKNFFYFPNTKPWEATDAIQNKGTDSSGEERKEVGSSKEAPDKSKSDSAPEGTS